MLPLVDAELVLLDGGQAVVVLPGEGELPEGGGEGWGGLGGRGAGEGVAGEEVSSCLAPGRGAGDGFLFPGCGNKLEREKEAATAPQSWIQLAPAVGIASVQH